MADMQKYNSHQYETEIVEYVDPNMRQVNPNASLIIPVLRRWYVVLLALILILAVGVPVIYYVVGTQYDTEAAIQISPVINPIMYESTDQLPPYDVFKNTQASLLKSDRVLNLVADEVKGKELIFFEDQDKSILGALREMVTDEDIMFLPDKETEFIFIQMTTKHPEHAEALVNAFLNAYKVIISTEETGSEEKKLSILQDRQKEIENKMQMQRQGIRQLMEQYGTGELSPRQELMLEQVGRLQEELISISIRRLSLESQLQMKQKQLSSDSISLTTLNTRKRELIDSDPLITLLREDVQVYEKMVIEAENTMVSTNPELVRRKEILDKYKARLDAQLAKVTDNIESQIRQEEKQAQSQEIEEIDLQLIQAIAYENKINEKLSAADSNTIWLGRIQLEINDANEELAQTKQMLTEVNRELDKLKIERYRPGRIEIDSYARSIEATGKKPQLAIAVAFGGIAIGIGLALIIDRLDQSLRGPEDVAERAGIRIIGTTTSSHEVDKNHLGQHLYDDYQTIQANLGLMDEDNMTKIIVVSSPGKGDGKTTFSINLATSFAQSGKKTLLIDGDLRQPDIALAMDMDSSQRGLQDYLFGAELNRSLYKYGSLPLYILAADERNSGDALNLLANPNTQAKLRVLAEHFDQIIIDSPPVLAFADALVLGKIADGVILTSQVGHTTRPDIKEATEKLREVGARVLGTVVNNVKVSHSDRRYSYGYGYSSGTGDDVRRKAQKQKNVRPLLISSNMQTSENILPPDEME